MILVQEFQVDLHQLMLKETINELTIGVKQIYQGAWNPVMGLTDSYSRHIWGIVSDPGTFKHPFTGETIPIRAKWIVETAGPNEKLRNSIRCRNVESSITKLGKSWCRCSCNK